MGLNVKETQLCRMVKDSTKSSYTFLQEHPFFSCALFVCFILYMFLSYIYSFLAYLSPFLVCAAIFVRIFWSSEKTQFRYVKKVEEEKLEQKRFEPRHPRIPNNRRRELLYKYPSQNATSRRRNFRGKKWDVYGGLEEKAKDLSAVFHNEFTSRSSRSKGVNRYFYKGESSLDNELSTEKNQAPRKQMLRSEPSMRDLVEAGSNEIKREKVEDGDDEDEDETQEEEGNKAIEWNENDQKNLMDLGISELERNKRLESLMAKRKERKMFKLQPEDSLADKKTPIPRHIQPVLISRGKSFDEGIDGLEMPGSAPSVVPNSFYDIPYDPFEEKPNLIGGSFHQEFNIEQNSLDPHFSSEPKQEHGARELNPFYNSGKKNLDKFPFPRLRKLPDKGSHDWLIDQLIYNEGGESGFQAPKSLEKREEIAAHEEDRKFESDVTGIKDEKTANVNEAKFKADHTSEPSLVPNTSNVETSSVTEKQGLRFALPHGGLLNFPISNAAAAATNVNEYQSFPSPISRRHENMFLRNCHTPTYSIASDLQVEVSEVGSLASTVDENGETNSNTDRDSVLYDGDIDRDVISSGSEELWGASFNGRPAHRASEEDIAEANNDSKDAALTVALRQIEEENGADVSCMSTRSHENDDTPTQPRNTDHNIFGYMKYSVGRNEAPQSSNSYSVSSPPKQLIDNSVDYLPNETQPQVSEVWSNLSENLIDGAHVINDFNNLAAIEQDNTENSRSNEGPSTLVARQESIDDTSIYSIASSPRSVLPEKTMADEVLGSAYDQQETSSGEHPHETMPQLDQILMDAATHETHNIDLNHSQAQTNLPESSMEEINIFAYTNDAEVSNKAEEDMSRNHKNGEDNSSHLNRQEAIAESTKQAGETTIEKMDEKSRELVDDKVQSTDLVENNNNEKPADGSTYEDLSQVRITEPTIPNKEVNEGLPITEPTILNKKPNEGLPITEPIVPNKEAIPNKEANEGLPISEPTIPNKEANEGLLITEPTIQEANEELPITEPTIPNKEAKEGLPMIEPTIPNKEANEGLPITELRIPNKEANKEANEGLSITEPRIPNKEANKGLPITEPTIPNKEAKERLPITEPTILNKEANDRLPKDS